MAGVSGNTWRPKRCFRPQKSAQLASKDTLAIEKKEFLKISRYKKTVLRRPSPLKPFLLPIGLNVAAQVLGKNKP